MANTEKDVAIENHVRVIFGDRAKGSWEYQAALRLANQLWDVAIDAAARKLECRTLSRPERSDYFNPYSEAAEIRKLKVAGPTPDPERGEKQNGNI